MSDQAAQKDNNGNETQAKPSADRAILAYVSKKLERITSALYLITSSLPTEEPLRHSIRQKSLQLLSVTFSFAEQAIDAAALSGQIQSTVREVTALLQVARNARLVSEMNYQVLEQELSSVLEVTGSKIQPEGYPELDDSYFKIQPLSPEQSLSGSSTASGVRSLSTSLPSRSLPRSRPPAAGDEPSAGVKERRRQAILDIIKDKGRVNIKDISRSVQGCSRKTIQRELLALVEEGVITKEGERRWSTYALV